jgi:PTS system nitrogen regulatory IIA component
MNMNARAAAHLLCVPEAKIYEWVNEGILPSYKIQEQVRFNRVELLEWAASRRLRVAPELFEDERRGTNRTALRLSLALAAGGIHRDIVAVDKRMALRALAKLLPLPPTIDPETIANLISAREGVTPVGDGIAIPHARAPVVLPIQEPIVLLGFLARSIDVDAPDRKPAGALFMVFSPTIRTHLDVLAKIAFALSNRGIHALIERHAPSAEILDALSELEAAAVRAPSSLEDSSE